MLLAGDIGGTKTTLAVYSTEDGPRSPLAEATFHSRQYRDLESIVREFQSSHRQAVDRAVFGVSGPVVDGRVTTTNLPWELDEQRLQSELKLDSARLINDLAALANSVPHLEPEDLETLDAAEPDPHGSIAVIAPGTGLGEAFLTWDGAHYRPHASEGGHADFAPTNPLEIELLRYVRVRHEHVSYELVCSGRGLPNIYAFLKDSRAEQEPRWLTEKLAAADDPTPIIVDAALDDSRPCPICTTTLKLFVSILGAEAGNLALTVVATGGVYVGGGMSPHLLPALQRDAFMETFRRKGRLSDLVARVPVHVIVNPKAGLLGAAYAGLEP